MATTAYLFPGQGTQDPEALTLVRVQAPDLLDLCIDLLGEEPFTRCDESTRFAQPAILLAGLAAWRGTVPAEDRAYAGHSLGELTALAAAGALSERDAVRLAVVRGDAMARAAERDPGQGMLAVLKGSVAEAQSLADDHGLVLANDNAPGEVVLSGSRDALQSARGDARDRGLRAIALNVTGAFHCPAMAPARTAFSQAAASVDWREPDGLVFSGMTAQPFTGPVGELSAAITAPVRWREVMAALYRHGCQNFIDLGPGDVLAKLVDRNPPQLELAHDPV